MALHFEVLGNYRITFGHLSNLFSFVDAKMTTDVLAECRSDLLQISPNTCPIYQPGKVILLGLQQKAHCDMFTI